jgi:hypothetical protein
MNMLKDYREKYFSGLDGSQTQTVLGNLLEIFYNNWETFELPESGFAIPDDFKQRLITPPQGLPPVLAQNGDQIEILTTQAVHSLKEVGGYLDGLKENFNNFITGNINQILNYGYASTFKSYWGESYFYQNALPAFFDHRDGSDFDYGELAQDENAGRKAGCSRFYWRWLCDNGWFAPREVSRVVFADDQILNQVISNLNPDAPSPNAYENLTNDGRNYWQEPDHLIFSNSLDAYFSYQQQPRPDFLAGGDQNERGYGRESITSWDRTSGNYLSNLVPERNGVPAGASHFRYTIDSAPAFREYNEGLSYNNLTFYVPQEINSHWGSGIKIDPLQPPAWYKGPRELWLNALYYGEDVTYSGKNITGYDPLTGSGGYETEIDDVKNIALENTLSAFWQASYGGEARTLEETFKLADYSWPTNMLAYLGKMAGSYTANMFIIRDFNKRERKKYDTAMTKWEEECDQAWLDYAQGLKKEAERKSAEARLLARERARMSTVKKEEIVRLYRKAASRRAEERRQQSKQKKI